jgi:hypothetical protein
MREDEGRRRQFNIDGGNPGSIPGESTQLIRKVAG